MPKVTVIPAISNPKSPLFATMEVRKKRVAAYARVSTDSDEQFTSYEAQVDYYTRYILSKSEWELVKVYTDEGITGTSTKHREGFKEMVKDALDGKIDLIVTKSVSRFARNTVDSLVTIRQLKENNVECYFEKENIWTLDSKGELLLTIMSSLAQEESRSISENVTWGQRKRFSDGKVSMPYKRFLGYEKGKDGKPQIVESEAKVVRLIYKLFLEGKTPIWICKHLESLEIKTPGGKNKWSKSTVLSILQNEKYKGDALLQKKFTVDFLTKKQKVNEGEVPQYYVENSHPPIIEPNEWEHTQAEIARRKRLNSTYSGRKVLSSKLVCEDCGSFYGSKVWHSNSKYRKEIWQCNKKFDNGDKCQTPTFDEEEIKQMFIKAYNLLMSQKGQVIEDCEIMRATLMDCSDLDTDIEHQTQEVQVIAEMVKSLVEENATTIQSQEEYNKKYNGLVKRYEKASEKLEKLQSERVRREQRDNSMVVFIQNLQQQPDILTQWDDGIWMLMVEKAIVHKDKRITFVFYNETHITVGA